jgi:flagellar biosynthesis protein
MNHDQNNPRQAVALRYAPKSDRAPKLTAKGRGYVADRILELARDHNIPIRHDHNLLQVLSRLDLNEEIPPEVYKAVAEILAFIYRLSNRQLTKSEKIPSLTNREL